MAWLSLPARPGSAFTFPLCLTFPSDRDGQDYQKFAVFSTSTFAIRAACSDRDGESHQQRHAGAGIGRLPPCVFRGPECVLTAFCRFDLFCDWVPAYCCVAAGPGYSASAASTLHLHICPGTAGFIVCVESGWEGGSSSADPSYFTTRRPPALPAWLQLQSPRPSRCCASLSTTKCEWRARLEEL